MNEIRTITPGDEIEIADSTRIACPPRQSDQSRRIAILQMSKECLGKMLYLPEGVSVDRISIDQDIRNDAVLIRVSAPADCEYLPRVAEGAVIPIIAEYPLEKKY